MDSDAKNVQDLIPPPLCKHPLLFTQDDEKLQIDLWLDLFDNYMPSFFKSNPTLLSSTSTNRMIEEDIQYIHEQYMANQADKHKLLLRTFKFDSERHCYRSVYHLGWQEIVNELEQREGDTLMVAVFMHQNFDECDFGQPEWKDRFQMNEEYAKYLKEIDYNQEDFIPPLEHLVVLCAFSMEEVNAKSQICLQYV
jgi:hypothetical protein